MTMLSDWFARARLLQLLCQPNPLCILFFPFPRSFHKVVLQKEEQQQHQVITLHACMLFNEPIITGPLKKPLMYRGTI